jgi:periplasmic divalent cation tolerance protein
MSGSYLQVCTAVPSEEAAGRLARCVVEARLAAAVQVVGPIRSTYWWGGRIHSATEWLCIGKTTASRFQELRALIAAHHPYAHHPYAHHPYAHHPYAHHPYEVPAISATPISHGSGDYLAWIVWEASGSTPPRSKGE